MCENSQNDLTSKLNESIDNLRSDMDDLISQLNNKISLNSSINIPSLQSKKELDINRETILNEFTQYNPIFVPDFIKDKKIDMNLPKFLNLSQVLGNLCNKEVEKLKQKEKIISKRISSCNSISNYIDSFTHFIKTNIILIEKWNNSYLRISNSFNPSNDDILFFIQSIITENKFQFPLKFLYKSFKYYNVTNRKKILTSSLKRFSSDLLYTSSISIPKTPKNLENEIKRISTFCGIPFDLHSHDGQKFLYHCEKAFTDIFLIKVPIDFFDITKVENPSENDTLSMIDNTISNSTHIDKGLIESFKFLFTGNLEEMTKHFNNELFKFNIRKEVNKDHLIYFMKIQFVKNKKTIISLYNNCKSLISLKSRLTKTQFSDEDVNILFKQNMHLILAFASKLVNKTFGELDTNSIIETALFLEYRYEKSKGKLINALLTIYDHTNDESINSLILELINKRPNLFYDPLKSYEKQFELNVDLLDTIGECMWLMINLQILFEQISSPSTPKNNKDIYLLSNDSVPISRFEVFPRLLSVLKFYQKAPLIAEEICESLSINYLRFNLHISLAIWSLLLEDIKEFTKQCPFPFEKTQIPHLTQDVYHLFSNKIFDNFDEIEKYLNDLKEHKKETFTTFLRNFVRLNKCITKLQNCYILQQKLIPIYNEQLNTNLSAPSFELPLLTPEYLLNSDFDEKIESIYQTHNQFTKILTIAVKFNNYQSDSLYIRNHFDLSKLGRDFSNLQYEINIKNNLNEFILFSMFYSPEDFSIDKPLCDLSTNPSYLKYVSLYELAFMAQLENSFFHFNPVKEYFNFSETFYNPETRSLSPFVIPTVSQVMNLPEEKINDAYLLISHRIRICHIIRFESVIQSPIKQVFNYLAIGKLNWNGSLLSHLLSEIENHPFTDKSAVFEAFDYVLFFRINITILSTIFSLCQSGNIDQDIINNMKDTWIEIHKNRVPSISGDYLVLNRYLPKWIDLFLPNLVESSKILLTNQFTIVDNNLADKLIMYPELKSLEIIIKEFNSMLSILAVSILHSKEKLENCTIEQAVKNISQADLIEHSVSSPSLNTTIKKKGVSFETIQNLIIQKQIDDLNKLSEFINTKVSKSNYSTASKPDYYNEKKALLKQQPYIPNPTDINRQINLEMNYRFGKLVQKLREFLQIPNLTKEKLTELCKNLSPFISLSENPSYSILYKNKKPINARIQTDVERFCRIYSSYIRNECDEIKINEENQHLLNQLERCFKNDQYSQYQVNFTTKNSEKIMELNQLRDKLDEMSNMQKEDDEIIKESVKKEYNTLIDDLRNLIEKEKQKFARYHDKLYGNVKNSIQSHILSDKEIEMAIRVPQKDENSIQNKINDDEQKVKTQKNNEEDKQTKTNKTQIQQNNENNEFPKLQQQKPNNNDEFPKLQQKSNSNDEFPKLQQKSNNNDEFPKLQQKPNNNDEFPKLQQKSNSNDEFPKLQQKPNNDDAFPKLQQKPNNNDAFPKLQQKPNNNNDAFPKLQQKPNNDDAFPKLQPSPTQNTENGDDEKELKFNHHVQFSPDSSRRMNRGDLTNTNDDSIDDDNTECRRSRPPSSTAGFLRAGERLPTPPHSPNPRNGSRTATPNTKTRFPTPPLQNRTNSSTPLKRRNVHNSIFSAYMNRCQIEKAENEIDRLKKEILRIRIVHCMNLFAMEKHYTTKIETATQEYREINTILWNSKRNFEEDVRTITSKIEECYSELADYEAEIEATKAKIEKRKQQTIQLNHWKHVNLQTCDSIQSQLKQFNNTNNSLDIDVLTLIKKVEESRAELEALIAETEEFEEQFEHEIREPMATIDYYRRKIKQAKCETALIRYEAQQKMQQTQISNYESCNNNKEEEEKEEIENDERLNPKCFKFKLNNKENIDNDDVEEDDEIEQELEDMELEKMQESDSCEEQENSNESESQSFSQASSYRTIQENNQNDENEISEIQKYMIINQQIEALNEDLRRQIKEIEEKKANMKPELRESIEQLTTEPQATPRPLINQSNDKKIFKPAPKPRRSHHQTMKATLI